MSEHIPQAFVDDLLSRVDIVQLIDKYVPLKKAGTNYQSLCPFHQEKSPSFTVSPIKQFYYCFGCGASGSAIGFLMSYLKLGFVEAIETLAQEVGVDVPTSHHSKQQSLEPLYRLMNEVSSFYHQKLLKHDSAMSYLSQQRQLSNKTIKQFEIGYAPAAWDQLKKNFSDQQVVDLKVTGMLIAKGKGDSYDRFRDRIMFPIRDRRGRVIAFGGRIINDGQPKYLNSPETPIFHKSQELYGLYQVLQRHQKVDRLLVVEGYMDVIALADQGVNNAVATLGTAVTAKHVQRLFQVCNDVLFCFDGDRAGRQAAWRTVEVILPLLQDHWQPRFMFLPEGEDPDSLVRSEGKQRFEQRLQRAHSLSKLFLRYMAAQSDMETLDGRARFAHLALQGLRKVSSPIMRNMMKEAVAQMASIELSALDKIVASTDDNLSVTKPKADKTEAPRTAARQQSRMTPLRKAIILLLQHPQLVEHCHDLPSLDQPGWPLFKAMVELLKQQPKLSTAAIVEHWRDKAECQQLHLLAQVDLPLLDRLDSDKLALEFIDILNDLGRRQSDEWQINTLFNKLRQQNISDAEKIQLEQLIKQRHSKIGAVADAKLKKSK